MDTEEVNLSTENFLPSSPTSLNKKQNTTNTKGKKRTLTDNDEMQIDEVSGIEGKAKSATQKPKRKKQTSLELRKIPVPSHRYNIFLLVIILFN